MQLLLGSRDEISDPHYIIRKEVSCTFYIYKGKQTNFLYSSSQVSLKAHCVPKLLASKKEERGKKRQREEERERGEKSKILRRTLSERDYWVGTSGAFISKRTSHTATMMWKDEVFELPARYINNNILTQ